MAPLTYLAKVFSWKLAQSPYLFIHRKNNAKTLDWTFHQLDIVMNVCVFGVVGGILLVIPNVQAYSLYTVSLCISIGLFNDCMPHKY